MEDLPDIPTHILNDNILPILLREIEGVSDDNVHEENMRILASFVGLREVCQHWKDTVEDMVEYHALRLAVWDAGQVGVTVHTEAPVDVFFAAKYQSNLELFSSSQRMVLPMEAYKLTTPMKELSIFDLRDLREILFIGQLQEEFLPKNAWEWETDQVWIPPLER